MAKIVWKEVPTSSNVKRIGWQEDPPALIVEWVKGRVSEYAGVDGELFEKLEKAPSVGSALNSEVKGKFQHRYIG